LGNLDGIVMLGVALGWWAVENHRPYWLSLASTLILTKPAIGLPILILYWWWQQDYRVIIVPALATVLAQFVYGWAWPIRWIQTLFHGMELVARSMTISWFPYGLLAFLIILLPLPRWDRVIAMLSATFLGSPFAGLYSLVTLLAWPIPRWTFLLFSLDLWLIGPRFVNEPHRYVWGPRLGLVGVLVWLVWRNRASQVQTIRQLKFTSFNPP
jgi:hypothetical protein